MIYYLLLIIMTIIGSVASLFLKKASANFTIKNLFKNKNLIIGGVLYFLSACINIYVLKFLEYSVVLPLTAITYIWTLFLSYKYLNENIGIKKILGIFLILIGAIFLVL